MTTKIENPMTIVDCGCFAEIKETDYDGNCGTCPICSEIAAVIVVCKDCDDEGDGCTCIEDAERDAEMKRMYSLYKAEVKTGIYIPEGTKPELNPDLDGVY